MIVPNKEIVKSLNKRRKFRTALRNVGKEMEKENSSGVFINSFQSLRQTQKLFEQKNIFL